MVLDVHGTRDGERRYVRKTKSIKTQVKSSQGKRRADTEASRPHVMETSSPPEKGPAEKTRRTADETARPTRLAGEKRRGFYDQTKRHKARRRIGPAPYMESARDRAGRKRKAIEVGPATVERTVNGKYEWRDAGLRARRDKTIERTETSQARRRPRDPG